MAAATALAAGLLTVTAGAASAIVLPQPQNLETTGLNYGYAMAWEAPANTEGLTGYRARLFLASDTTSAIKSQTLTASDFDRDDIFAEFSGLTAGAKYVGTVTSVFGAEESAPAVGTVSQAYRPIGKVGSLKVVPGNKRITASWKRPATDALTGPVTAYLVLAETDDMWAFPEFAITGPSDTSATLTDLTNGETYTVTVMAGSVDAGLPAVTKARPLGKPGKPKSLTVSWASKTKAKLRWKAPSSSKAAPVAGYVVRVDGKKVKIIKGKKSTTVKVKAPKRGKKYRFTVRAYNPVTQSSAAVKKATRP